MSASQPTIAAIATTSGRSGVGIIRLSGKNLLPLVQTLSGGRTPEPRTALYTDFLGGDKQPIDNGILLYFAVPTSFTGEDVIELWGHGGPVVMGILLSHCLEPSTRVAGPGGFTKRAFLNNKLDLTQAGSVADFINASSKSTAHMALHSLKGAFSQHTHKLVNGFIALRILVETMLDFPEEDISFPEVTDTHDKLQALQGRLKTVLASAEQGTILHEGMNVVLVGASNVGKSSLLNALADDDIAIVINITDTTHDTVRERIALDGVPVHIIDTADLHETDDVVEQIGIGRNRRAVSKTGVALILINPHEGMNAKTQAILNSLPEDLKEIEIHNKADLTGEPVAVRSDGLAQTDTDTIIGLSAKTGTGLNLLKRVLSQEVGWQGEGENLFLAHSRHLNALHEAEAELEDAALCDNNQIELFTEHLHLTQNMYSGIIGEFTTDDLPGVIFSRFCIGK